MLRIAIITLLIGALMSAIGWISFSNGDQEATIRIDKERVKQDTHEASERVQEFVEELQQPQPGDAVETDVMTTPEEQPIPPQLHADQ